MPTVRCEQMVHGGVCVAHDDDGATLLVEGAIPGELAEVELRFRKGRTWFATVTRVVEASPDRVPAPCPYVPQCGGCQWQHIAYARQLTLKRDIAVDAMRRQRVTVPEDVTVHGMPDPWRYRRRGEFHVVRGDQGLDDAGLGFNRARSWRPIAVDDCLIHHHTITDSLGALRGAVHRGGTAALDTLRLTVGEEGRELLVRGKPQRALRADVLDETAQRLPQGVTLSTDATTLRWRGRVFRITPDAFMQVNWGLMDTLYERVLARLGECAGLRVVDAYAGIGVLAVALATRAREVVCIESNRGTARLGVLNARVNEVADRVRYVVAPVEDALPAMTARSIDRVVLDPPRAGCDSRVTGWLALTGPARIVYVSCDPATLARDLHVLVGSGPYEIESMDIVDMFPQTYHVESVVALRRDAEA